MLTVSDLRFDDVVDTVQVKYDGYIEHFPNKRKPVRCQALCASGGTYREVSMDQLSPLDGEAEIQYVASMRARSCCHEGEEPLDGCPEEPDSYRISGPDTDEDA